MIPEQAPAANGAGEDEENQLRRIYERLLEKKKANEPKPRDKESYGKTEPK